MIFKDKRRNERGLEAVQTSLPVFIVIICVFIRVVDLFMSHIRLINVDSYDNIRIN